MILQGLIEHSAQLLNGGAQLTEVVMSLGSLGWVHCRVTVSHDCVVAVTLVGARKSTENAVIHIIVRS